MRGLLPALLFALPACEGGDCAAAVADRQRTVLDVSWSTPRPGRSWVEFGLDGVADRATPAVDDGSTAHEAALVGLPALADVTWRAITERGGRQRVCEGVTSTGNLPAGLPELTVTTWDGSRADSSRPYAFGATQGDAAGLFVVDRRDGEWLWALPSAADRLQVDVEFADGSTDLLYNTLDASRREDVGTIERVDWRAETVRSARTALAHHVFTELPDGTLAWVALDVRRWVDPDDGRTYNVVGDQLFELTPEGEQRLVFTVWDVLEPERNDAWDTGFYPQGLDWTHANGLNYDAARDAYLLSLGNARMILEIDRATGAVLRNFGGPGGYAVASGSYDLFKQHDVLWTDDGHLLMSLTDASTGASGAVEYAVDDDAGTITSVWEHGLTGPKQNAFALGQAIRFDNGNTIVNWGGGGVAREVTPEGDIVWEMTVGSGSWFAQMTFFEDFYAPNAP